MQPLAVAVDAEEAHLAVDAAEGLEAVEHLLRVVKHRGRRIEAERRVGDDARVEPAAVGRRSRRSPCGR